MKQERKRPDRGRDYWEKNIAGFAGFYDRQSEENLAASLPVRAFYRALILPIEKNYMLQRYKLVTGYIENNVKAGTISADIGCGNGIYTRMLADKCDRVYAIDYTKSAIELTSGSLSKEQAKRVHFIQSDVTTNRIPKVDVAISIGVLPYVHKSQVFFDNILPYTDMFLFNFLDSGNPANVLRRLLPILNVRHYSYQSRNEITEQLTKHAFACCRTRKLATGFVIDSRKT